MEVLANEALQHGISSVVQACQGVRVNDGKARELQDRWLFLQTTLGVIQHNQLKKEVADVNITAALRRTTELAVETEGFLSKFHDLSYLLKMAQSESDKINFVQLGQQLEYRIEELDLGVTVDASRVQKRMDLQHENDMKNSEKLMERILNGCDRVEGHSDYTRAEMRSALASMRASRSKLHQEKEGAQKKGPPPNEITLESLRFIRKIGSGAFSEVWYGNWNITDVAIKRIKVGSRKAEAETILELPREISIHQQLRHPNIIHLFGMARTKDPLQASLVLEYAPGGSLFELLHGRGSVRLSPIEQATISVEVGAGLEYLHSSGVFHRDLKSANVLLGADGHFKLCDFGLSKVKQCGFQTSTSGGLQAGTHGWMAPEVLDNEIDKKTWHYDKIDAYALGIVFYEVIAQLLPFHELTSSQLFAAVVVRRRQPKLPSAIEMKAAPDLLEIMRECLSFDPMDRPLIDKRMLQRLKDVALCIEKKGDTNNKSSTPRQPPSEHRPEENVPVEGDHEVLQIIGDLHKAIENCDVDSTRSLLLFLKLRTTDLDNELPAERALERCVDCLESCGDYALEHRWGAAHVDLLCFIKLLALRSAARRGAVVFPNSVGNRLFRLVVAYKSFFAVDNTSQSKMSLFWKYKGMHAASVVESLLQLAEPMSEADAQKLKVFAGDVRTTMKLVFEGATKVMQSAKNDDKKKSVQSQSIAVEALNFVVHSYRDLAVGDVQEMVAQVTDLFTRDSQRLKHGCDWLILYGYLDLLVNAITRFNVISPESISLQLKIVQFLGSELPFKPAGRRVKKTERSDISKIIEARIVEALNVVLRHSAHEKVRVCAQNIISSFASKPKKKLSNPVDYFSDADTDGSALTDAQALDLQWFNFVGKHCTELSSVRPHIVSEALSLSSDSSLTQAVVNHIGTEAEDVRKNVDQFASNSAVNKSDHYWVCFCKRLIGSKSGSILGPRAPPEKPQDVNGGVFTEDEFVLNVAPLGYVEPQPDHDVGQDSTFTPLAPPLSQSQPQKMPEAAIRREVMKVSSEDFHPLVHRVLEDPDATTALTVEERITCIRSIVTMSKKANSKVEGSNVVCIVGVTSAGKSTVLNWLNGCTMMLDEDMNVCVQEPVQGGQRDSISDIGHDTFSSKTIVPCVYPLSGSALSLCDAPGFIESRGTEIALANAINVLSIAQKSQGIGFLQIFNVHELMVARGDSGKQSLEALARLFGGTENFNRFSHAVMFGLNFVSDMNAFHRAKHRLKILCEKSNMTIPDANIFCIDPLGHCCSDSRSQVLAHMKRMKKIPGVDCAEIFTQAPLNEKEILLLNDLKGGLLERCKVLWSKGDIQALLDSFVLLEELSQLGNQTLFREHLDEMRNFILSSVEMYAKVEVIARVKLPIGVAARAAVFECVDRLTTYSALDACFSEGAPIEQTIQSTVKQIAELESREQSERNNEFENKWKTIKILLEKDLDGQIQKNPDAFANVDLLSKDMLVTVADFCPFVTTVLSIVDQIKEEQRQRPKFYYSGDLRPLDKLKSHIEKSATDIIQSRLRDVKCQQQVNICTGSIGELEAQSGIVETRYSELLALGLLHETGEEALLCGVKKLETIGFNRTSVARLVNVLPILKETCYMQPVWPDKHDNVLGKLRDFVANLNRQAQTTLVAATFAQFQLDVDALDEKLVVGLGRSTSMPVALDLDCLENIPGLEDTTVAIRTAQATLKRDPTKFAASQEIWNRKQKELTAIAKRVIAENALGEATNALSELEQNYHDEGLQQRAVCAVQNVTAVSTQHGKMAYERVRGKFAFSCKQDGLVESHRTAAADFRRRGMVARNLYISLGMAEAAEELLDHEDKLRKHEAQILRDVNEQINVDTKTLLDAVRLGCAQFAESKGEDLNGVTEDVVGQLFAEGFITIEPKKKLKQMLALVVDVKGALHFYPDSSLDDATHKIQQTAQQIGEEAARFSVHLEELQAAKEARESIDLFGNTLETSMETNFKHYSASPLTLEALAQNDAFSREATAVLHSVQKLKADSPQVKKLHEAFGKRMGELKRRADLHLCQELAAAIDRWCVSDAVGNHVQDIREAFDTLKHYNSPRYEEKKETFEAFCRNKQEEGTIRTFIKAKNYNAIISTVRLLEKLGRELKMHMKIDLTMIHDTVNDFLDELFLKATDDIAKSVDSKDFLDFVHLKDFMEIGRELKQYLREQVADLKAHARNMFEQLSAEKITRRGTDDQVEKVAKTFVKYFGVATELGIVSEFTKQMNAFLLKIPPDKTDMLSQSIYQLHSSPPLEAICGDILSRFKVFSRVNTAIENRIRGGVSFDDALTKLTSTLDVNKENLRSCYQKYNDTFGQLLDAVVQEEYDAPQMIKAMHSLGKGISPYKRRRREDCLKIAELTARVCAHYSFVDAKETYFTGDKNTLLRVHMTQVLSIFLLLGLDSSNAPTGQINEVLTGEGKSISLAMTAAVFCFMGVEAKVVCYSTYLTHKDRVLFQDYFQSLGIASMVEYVTINELVNIEMRRSIPDMREQVRDFLKGNPLPKFTPSASNGVLLIDEVDIFFGSDFYGRLYYPGTDLEGPEAVDFMRYLWQNRMALLALSRDDAVKHVRGQHEIVQNFLDMYPRFDGLLDNYIDNCLWDLRRYFSSSDSTSFECEVVDDRIGQVDTTQGSISFTRIGPRYSFAYFHFNEQEGPDGGKLISDEAVERNVGVTVNCGRVLYAELPKLFKLILGVTGTLVSFRSEQKEILRNYGFQRMSYVPSTFQRQTLKKYTTQVVAGDRWDEYFDRIKAAIYEMVKAHRATLVFFETREGMQRFLAELDKKTIKLPNYHRPELLSESLFTERRDAIINRAINTNKVTLSTKTYMRGTDFKCRNSELSSLGGVHVLMTFLPETAADEVQAMGRTCRQNDPGSYQKILYAQDLVDRNLLRTRNADDGTSVPDLSEADEFVLEDGQKEEDRWEHFLVMKRTKQEIDNANQIMGKLEENSPSHQSTLEMSKLMIANRSDSTDRAMTILQQFNDSI